MTRLALALVALAAVPAQAQKLAFIDSERVLELMPEYRTAQQDVERLATQYQAEIDAVTRDADSRQADFAARELLYTSDERTRVLGEIASRRQAAEALRRRYFGPEGDLFREQQSRLRPVQERLLVAVETIATDDDYDFIFDRTGEYVFLYARPRNDLTERVIEELGLTVGAGRAPAGSVTAGPPTVDPGN